MRFRELIHRYRPIARKDVDSVLREIKSDYSRIEAQNNELLTRITREQQKSAELMAAVESERKISNTVLSILETLQQNADHLAAEYSTIADTIQLQRGDYAALNESIRIPDVQPFPRQYGKYSLSGFAMKKLLSDYTFDTVIDIGCGEGQHTEGFLEAGKTVTVVDIYETEYIKAHEADLHVIIDDFNTHDFDGAQYDCVWASHVLEHQLNVHNFLLKVHSVLKEGGVLAITVPPPRHLVAGGHVTIWNTGLLLYNMVLAGFDCKDACVLRYGYNLSVIVKKRTVNALGKCCYGAGDIRTISEYLPDGIPYAESKLDLNFNGDIERIHWNEETK